MESENKTEYLRKFGYREYKGTRKSNFWKVLDVIWFESTSTWSRSTFGKILLIVVAVSNLIGIIFAASLSVFLKPSTAEIRDALNGFVARYMQFFASYVVSSSGLRNPTDVAVIQIGFFLIALFGIAGSGLFADDRDGKVVEIYLSKLSKRDYVLGKLGAIVLYTNLFIMGPLLIVGFLNAQSYKINHLKILDFYFGIVLYSILVSLLLGSAILLLSVLVTKRQYASLGFFLVYVLGTVFGSVIYSQNRSNEFMLLLSPEGLITLLAYVCVGDFDLGITKGFGEPAAVLNLHDGIDLEYYHVYLVVFAYIAVFLALLIWKVHKLTTEDL